MTSLQISQVRSNIWKLYVMQGLIHSLILMPVIVLFFNSLGLTLAQILLLQTAYSVGIVVFEVPT